MPAVDGAFPAGVVHPGPMDTRVSPPPETFEQFRDRALAAGYGEVVERRWEPGLVLDTHTHPFAVWARVVQGEMWLGGRRGELHLRPGDGFELAFEEPHTERYGPEGATYWVARRHKR